MGAPKTETVKLSDIRLAPDNPDYDQTDGWQCNTSPAGSRVFFTKDSRVGGSGGEERRKREVGGGGEAVGGIVAAYAPASAPASGCGVKLELGRVQRVEFIVKFDDGSERYENLEASRPDLAHVAQMEQPDGEVSE